MRYGESPETVYYGESPETVDYIDHLEAENERLRDENAKLKAKSYLKQYGKEVIHHPLNLATVCSLKCNDAVLLDPKTHPIEARELIWRIVMR